MGVTEGDLQIDIDVDVILENCTIPLILLRRTWYVLNQRSAPA